MSIRAEDEVARICRDLIRIDTSNYGDGSGPGERKAAEYVAALIEEAGLEADIFESAPGRASVVTRMSGTRFLPAGTGGPRAPGRGAGTEAGLVRRPVQR